MAGVIASLGVRGGGVGFGLAETAGAGCCGVCAKDCGMVNPPLMAINMRAVDNFANEEKRVFVCMMR